MQQSKDKGHTVHHHWCGSGSSKASAVLLREPWRSSSGLRPHGDGGRAANLPTSRSWTYGQIGPRRRSLTTPAPVLPATERRLPRRRDLETPALTRRCRNRRLPLFKVCKDLLLHVQKYEKFGTMTFQVVIQVGRFGFLDIGTTPFQQGC